MRKTAAGDAAGFRPGTFDAFAARLPALLDTAARVTFDGFTAHGLGDLLDRSMAEALSGIEQLVRGLQASLQPA